MIELEQLIQLYQNHQYTALVAVIVFTALKLWAWVKPEVWRQVPAWAKPAIPIAAMALSGFADALQGGATWLDAVVAAGMLIAAHHVSKVKRLKKPAMPAPTTPRSNTATSVAGASMLILMLSGCAAFQSAVDTVEVAVCDSGILDSPALQTLAVANGVPIGVVAAIVSTVDGLCELWQDGVKARVADPGVAVADAIRERGLL